MWAVHFHHTELSASDGQIIVLNNIVRMRSFVLYIYLVWIYRDIERRQMCGETLRVCVCECVFVSGQGQIERQRQRHRQRERERKREKWWRGRGRGSSSYSFVMHMYLLSIRPWSAVDRKWSKQHDICWVHSFEVCIPALLRQFRLKAIYSQTDILTLFLADCLLCCQTIRK